MFCYLFFSSRGRHSRCALVTGVQTCALPILNMTPPTISPSRSIPSVVYGGQTAKPRRSDTKRATASPSINRIGHFIGQFGADDLVIEGLGRTDRKSTRLNSSH